MKLPMLSTAFCGFSLRFGVLIIAWFQIIIHLLILIFVGVVFLSTATAATAKMLNKDQYTKWKEYDFKKNNDNKADEAYKAFEKYSENITICVGVFAITFLAMVYFLYLTAAILLLFGAQKRRPGFLIMWIVFTIIGMFVAFKLMTHVGFLYILMNLYFTWVVCSFYRQLEENSDSHRQLEKDCNITTQPATRDAKLEVPVYVIPDAPPPYSDI